MRHCVAFALGFLFRSGLHAQPASKGTYFGELSIVLSAVTLSRTSLVYKGPLIGSACSCLVAGANLGGLADNDGAEPLCILVALWLRKIPPFSAFDVITFFIFHNQHNRSFTNL